MKHIAVTLLLMSAVVFSGGAYAAPAELNAGAVKPADPGVLLDAASLTQALDSPSKQVRYYAAAALAKLAGKVPFENADKVIPLLSQALSERGARVALIASEDVQTANILKQELARRGYIVDIATSETAAVNVALSAPLKDIILLDAAMNKAFKMLVRDYRTAGQAKVLIAPEGQVADLRAALGTRVAGFVSTPVDANAAVSVLDEVLKGLPAPAAKHLAAEFNLLASEALAAVCVMKSSLPLADATPALINALKLPDDVKLPCMAALTKVGAVEAVPALSLIARSGGGSPKARVTAIKTIDAISRKAGAMDPKAKALMDLLLLDSDLNVQNAAAIALGANDPVDSALKRLLDSPGVIVTKTVGK